MGTVSKALGLLDILARSNMPKGLTSVARDAGFDKATTRRLLVELVAHGFVEQDQQTRDYALGPSLQMLGRARENRFPLLRTIQPFVRTLAEQTDETVHATEYCAGVLLSIYVEESTKANRVSLEHGQKLPLHSTASGIAFLAASTDSFIESVARKPMVSFTAKTITQHDALISAVKEAAARGFSISNQSMEDGVHSVAAAIYDHAGKAIGTIAIAAPTMRMTPKLTEEFGHLVRGAAENVSQQLTGRKPDSAIRRVS